MEWDFETKKNTIAIWAKWKLKLITRFKGIKGIFQN